MEKERKLQIIRAAEKRFVKHGLHKTTLDEIARDLRISKSTLYHYFTSKEDLYFSTMRYEVEQYLLKAKEIFSKDLPSAEKIIEYLEFKSKIFDNYKLVLSLFVQFMNETFLEEEIQILKELYLQEEECLKQGLNNNNVKKEDTGISLAYTLVQYSWGIILNNKVTEKIQNNPGQIDQKIFGVLLNGTPE